MLDRRLQVLIDQDLWARLEREAERRSVSVSTLVREAIDDRYPGSTAKRRAALDAVLAETARRRGWSLASADRAFARAAGLAHLDPPSSSFLESARIAG